MKVIFLDFDGVLNSNRYFFIAGCEGLAIDPECMDLLKKLGERNRKSCNVGQRSRAENLLRTLLFIGSEYSAFLYCSECSLTCIIFRRQSCKLEYSREREEDDTDEAKRRETKYQTYDK